MSFVAPTGSLNEEREKLAAQVCTLQARISEIDSLLEGQGKGMPSSPPKIDRIGSTTESSKSMTVIPIRNKRPSIQNKARILSELMGHNTDNSAAEHVYLMRPTAPAQIIDSRDNIARLIGAPAIAYTRVIAHNHVVGITVVMLGMVNIVAAMFAFNKFLLDDWVCSICPLFTAAPFIYLVLRMNR
jgi:hypothetical protein